MALRIIPGKLITLGDGTSAFMELNADSVADLSTECEGYTIAAGSICLVIETFDIYVLNGDSNWEKKASLKGVIEGDNT